MRSEPALGDRKFWRLERPAEFLDLRAHEGDEFPVVHGGAPVVPSGELRVFEVFVQCCFGPFGPCLDAVWQVALPAVPRTVEYAGRFEAVELCEREGGHLVAPEEHRGIAKRELLCGSFSGQHERL